MRLTVQKAITAKIVSPNILRHIPGSPTSSYNTLSTKLVFPIPRYPVMRYEPPLVFSLISQVFSFSIILSLPIIKPAVGEPRWSENQDLCTYSKEGIGIFTLFTFELYFPNMSPSLFTVLSLLWAFLQVLLLLCWTWILYLLLVFVLSYSASILLILSKSPLPYYHTS